jgi:phosphoribosyl-AMP cyclohydrolase
VSAVDANLAPGAPVRFDADGLVPVATQDAATGEVLMLAFMNDAALAATRATGRAHYWSRSRGKLWRKGETSGNEQIVEGIYVNCERNSLLLRVRQTGAVCHDGYPTCFYRRLEPDDALTVVAERAFDPAAVYGQTADRPVPESSAAARDDAARDLFGAYAFLRDHDLSPVSGTSARLRAPAFDAAGRIADELDELAGVLDGTHAHADPGADLLLEGSQVVYWLILAALRANLSESDLALAASLAPTAARPPAAVAGDVRAASRAWRSAPPTASDLAVRCRDTLRLVASACSARAIDPLALLQRDLDDLRRRPYLAPCFAHDRAAEGNSTGHS